jgi:hypothetical protein
MIRELAKDGWFVEYRGSNHLAFQHPDAAYPVYTGATPSDGHRAIKNARAVMRRSLKAGATGRTLAS